MSGIANIKFVGLDSNIFIYNLEQNSQYIQFTDIIFSQLASKKLRAATSIISLTEILSYPETSKVEKQLTEDFFNTPNLKVLDVNKEVATVAAGIRRGYGLRLPDTIQLATALSSKAKAFITNDVRLKTFKEIKIVLLSDL